MQSRNELKNHDKTMLENEKAGTQEVILVAAIVLGFLGLISLLTGVVLVYLL